MKCTQKAFTLVELMVTLVIIGLLAVIAIPSYNQYVKRSKISEAYQTLGTMLTQQKTYYSDHHTFVSTDSNGTGGGNSILGGETFTAMPDWQDVGYPIPPGTKTYFAYSADAGHLDATGTPDCSPYSCGTSNVGLQSPTDTMRGMTQMLSYPGAGKQCGIPGSTYSASFFGVSSSEPNYDWVVLMAKGNLTPGTTKNCNFVMTILESGTNGIGQNRGFIEFTSDSLSASGGGGDGDAEDVIEDG